jgi:hypothetical protein
LYFLDPKGGGSVCFNRQNYNGYTFGRFPCPLPAGTGMNQLDQFCCGIANYQYCCNEQFVLIKCFFQIFYHLFYLNREFYRNQGGGYGDDNNLGKHGYSKYSHYSRSTNRTLAIILPIASLLVIIAAAIIVFLYYKKLRNAQSKGGKSSGVTRLIDNYSGKFIRR